MRKLLLVLAGVIGLSNASFAASCEGAKADLMTTLENAAAARDTNASDYATRAVLAVRSKRVAEKACGLEDTHRFILGLPQRWHSVLGAIHNNT